MRNYIYDIFGNKTTMMTYRNESLGPDSGDITTWLYDEASNSMTTKVYADGKGPSYSYTPDGRLSRRTWARGIVTDYSYDNWGSLTNTVYSDGTPAISLAYDALGRQTEARDAAGITTFLYDSFGSLTNETVVGVAGTNTIIRYWDDFGRTAGYALNGIRQTTIGYEPDKGRIATMETFPVHSTTPTQNFNYFKWNYLPGTDLKSSLSYPNGLTASWQYDVNNQLLQVCNATATNIISQYDYTYDAAGRRIACAKSGSAFTQDDTISYGYNARSELTNAVASVDADYRYAYAFDDIGNREIAAERGTNFSYSANSLNQYMAIEDFLPQFDDDANQTLVLSATGVWQVTYNGEKRAVRWMNGDMVITMSYDRMGRRIAKNRQGFVNDGYLQIADSLGNVYAWDPTEKIATRPLVWKRNGTHIAFYCHDGNKNVSEVVSLDGNEVTHYEYAPFGDVTVLRGESADTNPWCFSSEYTDYATKTVCYALRDYEVKSGRWLIGDYVEEFSDNNLFSMCRNDLVNRFDYLGAFGLTISINSYKMQRFRVISEYVYCPFMKCNECLEPCFWRPLNDKEDDYPLLRMTQTYTGGLSYYEIVHGVAEELMNYVKDKTVGFIEGRIFKWLSGEDLPGVPFFDELEALSNSKYKTYLLGSNYRVPGYANYIFTGYGHSVGDFHYYPSNHLMVPSCKNQDKTSTYYVPIGKPYWTERR